MDPNGETTPQQTARRSGPGTTSSSTASSPTTAPSSSAPSATPYDKPSFQGQSFRDWLHRQSTIPSDMYVRPSGTTSAETPGWTTSASLHSFYGDRSGATARQTPPSGPRRPSPAASSERSPPSAQPRKTGRWASSPSGLSSSL